MLASTLQRGADDFLVLVVAVDGGIGGQVAVERGRAELRRDAAGQLLGILADDLVEAVVPEAPDAHEAATPAASRSSRVSSRMPWMWSSSTWLTIRRSTGQRLLRVEVARLRESPAGAA